MKSKTHLLIFALVAALSLQSCSLSDLPPIHAKACYAGEHGEVCLGGNRSGMEFSGHLRDQEGSPDSAMRFGQPAQP